MENKRILFLDHDGVICLPDNFGTRWNGNGNGVFDNFDKKSIRVLNKIIEETDCEIVISSDWRLHCDLKFMSEFYLTQGIIKKPIGYTESLNQHPTLEGLDKLIERRVREINKYIIDNNVQNWVVVDDLNLGKTDIINSMDLVPKWKTNFVLTAKTTEGIKQSNKKETIIKKLLK